MPTEKHNASLTKQESILRAKTEWEQTFDAVSDLIMITDPTHTIVRVNRAMADRYGLTPAEVVGRKCFEVMHDTDSAPPACPHTCLLKDGKSQISEFYVAKLHGTFKVTMSPIFDANGRIKLSVHVARDVTEKRCHEELLAAQQKQLEEINTSLESRIAKAVALLRQKDDLLIQQSRLTAMSEMISSIAHQWRQPLNNIGLIVQGLQLAFKANDLSDEELDQDIADTMKVLHQISETINDFGNFFSYEEKSSTFVINELFSRSLPFITPSLKKEGIVVQFAEEPDVTAVGYPNEYIQTLLNVMLNARDALVDHRVENPFIAIRIFRENGRSVVTVRDNGGGINEDILPRIFDPYFTTKQQDMGAGIGLYMAKMIIEKKMHGSLSARNVEDGAEFRIEV